MSEISQEKRKLYQKRYKEKYHEEIKKSARERARKYRAENPEKSKRLQRERRAKNPEKYRAASRRYYHKSPEKWRLYARKMAKEIRLAVIIGYGGKCVCCNESQQEFLALDHVNGGGTQQRKRTHVHTLYRFVIQNNFPPEYRILCHNCNASLGHYGYCPHNLLRQE